MKRFLILGLGLAACGCVGPPEVVPAAASIAPGGGWAAIATEDDRRRLRRWRSAWTEALDQVRASTRAAALAGEGALFEPDAALAGARPAPGDYDCRTIKLGARGRSARDFIAYPPVRCRIEADGETLRFTALAGPQRPIGRLFADNDRRLVFLGTLRLGDEAASLRYGRDRERDMAGMLERVGERRWRLVLPYPHFESLLDVVELTPRH